MTGYLEEARRVYKDAAETPMMGLCCTTSPSMNLPGIRYPTAMLEMNYGCGASVHPRDIREGDRILYVGVGGGLELLQFAYFARRPGSVIAVDIVPEMVESARANLARAESINSWFESSFVEFRVGDAFDLPLDDASVNVAAQNCLFNIFRGNDLRRALEEMHRALVSGGRLALTDPISEVQIPDRLRRDDRLRAHCLAGAVSLDEYLDRVVEAGFGTIEVRSRKPYRVLDTARYPVDANILLESVEIVAFKDPVPEDGPCLFTGERAIYVGTEEEFDDGMGHVITRDIPLEVCRKTANRLRSLRREDVVVTPEDFQATGDGCC